MKRALLCMLLSVPLFAQTPVLPTREALDGWLLLFDGESLFGWTAEGAARWQPVAGVLQTAGTNPGWLRTNSSFADFVLTFEVRTAGETAVAFRWNGDGSPAENGYRVQLGGSAPGGITGLGKPKPISMAADQWHRVEIRSIADRLVVSINGQTVSDYKDTKHYRGHIAFEARPDQGVGFRNVKLKPEGLQSLFNGKDLTGWQVINVPSAQPKQGGGGPLAPLKKLFGGGPPKPPDPAVWTVQNGAIHVEKGAGLLQHGQLLDDFVLQVEIRTVASNSKHYPDSGVLFRNDAKAYASGYESQVHNEYAKKGGAEPVNFGTGGLTGLRPARRLVSRDNQFFLKTVIAHGRHVGIWIDGYQVMDYYDSRAEGASVSAGARTVAGGIAIEAHDSSTVADFRNVRAVALPKGPAVAGAPVTPGAAASPLAPATPVIPNVSAPGMPTVAIPTPTPGQDPRQAEVAALLIAALKEIDPEKQVPIYEQILAIDPNNQVANTNRKDALEAIKQTQEEQKKQAEAALEEEKKRQEVERQAEANETTRQQAVNQAESQLYSGDLDGASAQLAQAKKVAPMDPEVRRLENLIESRFRLKQRRAMLLSGAGVSAVLLMAVAFWKTRGKKEPYLEILDGPDKGKRYKLAEEVTHIGAIAEDGGHKNEVVVSDPARMVSRFHCQIHRKGSKLYLVDCRSANGTWLDKKRMKAGEYVPLKTGGRIDLGGACTLRLGVEKVKKGQEKKSAAGVGVGRPGV